MEKINKYRDNKGDEKEEKEEEGGRVRREGGRRESNNKVEKWVFIWIIIDISFCYFLVFCFCVVKYI